MTENICTWCERPLDPARAVDVCGEPMHDYCEEEFAAELDYFLAGSIKTLPKTRKERTQHEQAY